MHVSEVNVSDNVSLNLELISGARLLVSELLALSWFRPPPPPPRNPTLRFDVSAADPDSVFLLVWRVLD